MRTYKKCFPSLEKYILKPLKPDVFIHTWSDIGGCTKPNCGKINRDKITKGELEELYHPKVAVIEGFRDEYYYEKDGVKVPRKLKEREPLNCKCNIPMYYKIFVCNELKNQYERKQDFEYDMVIRFRPDIKLYQKVPDEVMDNLDVLWVPQHSLNKTQFKVTDTFVVSNSVIMDSYCSVWRYLDEYWKNPFGLGIYPENRIGERIYPFVRVGTRLTTYHCLFQNIDYEYFYMPYRVIRDKGSVLHRNILWWLENIFYGKFLQMKNEGRNNECK